MIIVTTRFSLQDPLTLAKAQAIFESTAAKYRGVPGLLRKHYVLSDDGKVAGGVYLWRDREHAERLYTPQWRAFVTEKYGKEPEVSFYECPVTVDNTLATADGATLDLASPRQPQSAAH